MRDAHSDPPVSAVDVTSFSVPQSASEGDRSARPAPAALFDLMSLDSQPAALKAPPAAANSAPVLRLSGEITYCSIVWPLCASVPAPLRHMELWCCCAPSDERSCLTSLERSLGLLAELSVVQAGSVMRLTGATFAEPSDWTGVDWADLVPGVGGTGLSFLQDSRVDMHPSIGWYAHQPAGAAHPTFCPHSSAQRWTTGPHCSSHICTHSVT